MHMKLSKTISSLAAVVEGKVAYFLTLLNLTMMAYRVRHCRCHCHYQQITLHIAYVPFHLWFVLCCIVLLMLVHIFLANDTNGWKSCIFCFPWCRFDGFTSTFQDKLFRGYNMEIHNQIFYTTLCSCVLSLTGMFSCSVGSMITLLVLLMFGNGAREHWINLRIIHSY